MAVIKRLTCTSCKKSQEVRTLERKPSACSCGGKREYGEKWIVSLILEGAGGEKVRYFKAYSVLKTEALAHEAEMKATRLVPVVATSSFQSLATFFEEWCDTKVAEGTLGKLSAKLRIPTHVGHPFRFMSATYSD
jgi:hypothetical protein